MNVQCSGGSRMYRRWEPWGWEAQRPAIGSWQLHDKLMKNSTLTILWSFDIWSKLERWESWISACLVSWPKTKKKYHFEVLSSLIVCNDNKPFLNWIVTCDESQWWKPLIYKTASDDQLSGWIEKQLQITSHLGGLLLIWSTTALRIQAKPLHLRSMLSKSRRCKENCNTWSHYGSTERAQLFSSTIPECTSFPQ